MSQSSMNGEPLRRTVTVRNTQGMHMRPLTTFAELAGKFQSNVLVSQEGREPANGKSLLNLMACAMVEQGTPLVIEVQGPDAAEAMEALVKFFDELIVIEP
jgi:phosphotransferase system HPr (HPr) family protein